MNTFPCGSKKPPAATSHTVPPDASICSTAGSSRLNTAAALITPPAKPKHSRPALGDMRFLKKKTAAAPSDVRAKVNSVPYAANKKDLIVSPRYLSYAKRYDEVLMSFYA